MFHTLTNVQQGAVPLQQYIDNRCGQLRVGLRSLAYPVGWWNVGAMESFSWRLVGGLATIIRADPGFYGFSMLQSLIESADPTTSLVVNPVNGIANLIVAAGHEIILTDGLLDLLGFDDLSGQWLTAGSYAGDRIINFMGVGALNVHLDQMNSTYNVVDGASSNLLATIGLCDCKFGDIRTIRFEHPEFKRLQEGTISELKVTIRDINGDIIDNHNLEIQAILEIR